MAQECIKLPDIGEGVAEAELVEWSVTIGDLVQEDDVLGAVMTDKATVEIPAPVAGKIIWLGADVGEIIAVGSEIIRIATDGDTAPTPDSVAAIAEPFTQKASKAPDSNDEDVTPPPAQTRSAQPKVLASPAVRARAKKEGVDLSQVTGTAALGRIRQSDLTAFLESHRGAAASPGEGAPISAPYQPLSAPSKVTPVVGLRRRISEKMAIAAREIPHITYVDAVDMTALENLRHELNSNRKDDQPKLTLLPLFMQSLVKALADYPQMNAHFDGQNGKIHAYEPIHIGIATQTDAGLMVPVVKDAQDKSIWDNAIAITQLSQGARAGSLPRDTLTGSTITITSLGALGGLVTTPIINHPEVAILGINKLETRPHWDGTQFQPRKMMNISASFDHRVIDGWDAAVFIQRIRALLETPALMFMD